MIDTDKYEGVKGSLVHIIPHEVWVTLTPAAQALIADAPLLLAEVKRLREQGGKLIEAAERVRSDISDQDTGWYYQLGNHIEKMNRLVKE